MIELVYVDDEHMDIKVHGKVVAYADHGPHGWDGMEGIREAVLAIARALKVEVTEDGEPGF